MDSSKLLSFLLGIIVVLIFAKMFQPPCVVIKGPKQLKASV